MIIDGHTHVFCQDTQAYPLADPESSYRPATDGSAARLRECMAVSGVDRALTITAGFYGWDNRSTLDERAGNEDWLAAGVLVDPTSPSAAQDLAALVDAGASGLRIQRHLHYDGDLDDPSITPLWAAAADLDITVDINATHEEYGTVENRLREFPSARFILDHCGYVSAALAPAGPTVAPVLELARYPNAYAKLTFLPVASREAFPFADVHGMVREIVDAFGPERCLFGTNFPQAQYCPELTYAQCVELFTEAVPLSRQERDWILGGTAATLWRWDQ